MKGDGKGIIHSYLSLRRTVGWMGMLLPFVLLLVPSLLSLSFVVHRSISYYYHTDMRDILVGTICSIGLFLFFYRGYDWRDRWTANVAAVAAIGVALFPASEDRTLTVVHAMHVFFGVVFFLALAFFSLYLFRLSDEESGPRTPEKKKRDTVYLASGITIIAGMVLVVADYQLNLEAFSVSFIGEAVALVAFGVAWLIKGETILVDKSGTVNDEQSRTPAG